MYNEKGEVSMSPPTEAQKRASNKYNKEHMATLGCKVTKEQARAFKEFCESKDSTTNKELRNYVLSCIPESSSGSDKAGGTDESGN